jgi:D-alanyl-D-alanine carboxypeptidase/D-alanyl-D-alanine-endopeptidase (penicillin-binding protein 4)
MRQFRLPAFTLLICCATAAVSLACCQPAVGQNTSLRTTVEQLLADPAVARSHWGIDVTRLDGSPVLAINEGQFFQPASNNKLFTTAAAMALLPVDKSLTTTITSLTAPHAGVVKGDIVLHGVGDANLSGRAIPYVSPAPTIPGPHQPVNELRYIDEMADEIKASGIKRVAGDVIGDDTLMPWQPYGAGWAMDYAMWYYGAPVNSLMIADNAIHLSIAPGAAANRPALVTLNPALPYYTVENHIVTMDKGAQTHIDVERSAMVTGGSRALRLYGTIPAAADPQSYTIAIEDPAEYAAMALKAALQQRGIAVTGMARARHRVEPSYAFLREVAEPIPDLEPVMTLDCPACAQAVESNVLARHTGPSLYEDVVVTNKISQNQHAELFLRQLGLRVAGEGSIAEGARVVRSFLTTRAGLDPDDFVFFDGSGLSGRDMVTPRAITQLLRYASTQPWGARWKASLPIGGEDGSLRERFSDAPLKDHVFAKTGTLGEAHALSGSLGCASGQTLVFSVLNNDHSPQSNADLKVMDQIVAAIAAAN